MTTPVGGAPDAMGTGDDLALLLAPTCCVALIVLGAMTHPSAPPMRPRLFVGLGRAPKLSLEAAVGGALATLVALIATLPDYVTFLNATRDQILRNAPPPPIWLLWVEWATAAAIGGVVFLAYLVVVGWLMTANRRLSGLWCLSFACWAFLCVGMACDLYAMLRTK